MSSFQSLDGYIDVNYAGHDYFYVGSAVAFPVPKSPMQTDLLRSQSSARTLGGSLYVYDRTVTTKTYLLIIPKVSSAVFTQILDFFDTVCSGIRKYMTWIDPLGNPRIVKFQGVIRVIPSGPDKNSVELALIEQYSDGFGRQP
jgi:hypothetical protein